MPALAHSLLATAQATIALSQKSFTLSALLAKRRLVYASTATQLSG
jgi:hypothetical protein